MENFNLKKFLVENKLTSNSRMLKEEQQPVETFTFGYDFEFIQEVEDYLADTYQEGTDYVTHIGRGDDAMNALDILNPELLQDQELMSLIRNCTGEGHFEEDDEDTGREEIEKWYLSTNPQADELSQEEEEAGIQAHFEEWNAVKDQYDSIEDYFEDVERQGDWY